MTEHQYLALSERLIALAVAVSCLEYLVRPGVLSDHGLAGWPVGRLSRPWKTGSWGWVLEAVMTSSRYRVVLAVRFGAALLLVLPWGGTVPRVLALGFVVVGAALAQVRSSYGHDGADQMCLVVGCALLIARVPTVADAALWFIALQACLAYTTAGLKKVASPVWRSGQALPGVLGTTIYGHASAYRILNGHPRVARLAGFSVMAMEAAFPLALIGLRPLTYLILACGLVFHLSTAVLMRLNTFFWAFVATYPAIFYVALAR
ncbi:hypothetical protein [Kineococcus rubinsiae]|uniref:hypothetical protein n=1 Tax=Kineococcus rubinsiae TaxID=2609562 RepID=UPI001431989A|nr:hypothetical protein [Kineococcus rubinsiae]NIZ90049.1 hypothetical protein [Kineococcus rubinsiae]